MSMNTLSQMLQQKHPIVTANLRDAWYDKLSNVYDRATCKPRYWRRRNGASEKVQGCVAWINGYNSALDEPLNTLRKQDERNYFIWMKDFCNRINLEVHQSLRKFSKRGCMCCIGICLYDFLRFEYLLTLLDQEQGSKTLQATGNNSIYLMDPMGIIWRRIAGGLRNAITCYLAAEIYYQCGHVYFEHLAILLNHGRKSRINLRGGVIDSYIFSNLLTKKYEASMLRARCNRASLLESVWNALNKLSIAQAYKILRVMHSSRGNDIYMHP